MGKWIFLLIMTAIVKSSRNQHTHGCSYKTIYDGRQITCVNVTAAFFQYSNLNLNRSRWLTCKSCNLSTITNDTFNFPKNSINYLVLIENSVISVSTLAFSKLSLLRVLNLRSNFLRRLSLRTFSGLKRLLQLDLSRNRLEALEEDRFLELENLDVLSLNENRISVVDPNAFAGLLNLKYLYLNHNNIEKLERQMFVHVPNLKMLYLESNRIAKVHLHTFSKLDNLNYLYLNNNSIHSLEPYNFKSLSSLIDLQLRHNNLREIDTSTFNGLKNIKFLYLGQNKLADIRPYGFIGLNSLEVLDLIGNKFEYFTMDYFKDMDNLNTLWLERNSISNLTARSHTQVQKSLKVLSFIQNKLERFNYRLLHDKVPRLEEVWVGENPWTCDFIIEMYDYFYFNNVSVCTSTNCSDAAIKSYIQSICFEPLRNETELTTELATDCTAKVSCSVLLLFVLILFVS